MRQWIIPAIGAVTPIALIVVNIAAFIVHHLEAFRLTITILAFVSGMMLNSWMGLSIYRWFKARYRDHALVHEANQDIVLIGGMGVIILISAATAWGCWLGLGNEKDLPNAPTFVIGIASILFPIVIQRYFQRAAAGRESRYQRTAGLATPAGSSPPAVTHGSERRP